MSQPIDTHHLPRHIAIIMDGNGRWAALRGMKRVEGHRVGVETAEEIIMHARKTGIAYLTLYAFSKENWERPPDEVSALMHLLKEFLICKKDKMQKNGIRLNTIGNREVLPADVRKTLDQVIDETSCGSDMVLTLALSYGSRDEIIRAIGRLIKKDDRLSEESFANSLDTAGMPDPDLIIRTSGERRLSNFLLWQAAYAEFVFDDCLWPDFSNEHLDRAIVDYQSRERRFGKTGEQIR